VYIESPAGNLYLKGLEAVQRQADAFNPRRKTALSKQETTAFIRAVITDLLKEEKVRD
jgi:hypothetical protein